MPPGATRVCSTLTRRTASRSCCCGRRASVPGSWSFEKVTVVDVILLAVVVALTIWVHWAEDQADRSADIVYAAMDSLKAALGSYPSLQP